MREIIDIDWSVVKDRLEYVTKQHDEIERPNHAERMHYLKTLRDRLMKGERSNDLYNSILDLQV